MVENISLPPEVEKVLDKRSEMGIVGDLGRFTQYQAATAIEKAASNPSGGGAGDAMTMGMGLAMGQRMAEAMSDPGRKGAGPPLSPPRAPLLGLQGAAGRSLRPERPPCRDPGRPLSRSTPSGETGCRAGSPRSESRTVGALPELGPATAAVILSRFTRH